MKLGHRHNNVNVLFQRFIWIVVAVVVVVITIISNHHHSQYDNNTFSFVLFFVDATQSDTKYSYNYKTDWKQQQQEFSWSTKPIQPTSLYENDNNHHDITTIMSTDTSIQSTLFQTNNNNYNQNSMNNNFVRKSKITIHENDNTNDNIPNYNDDDDNLVQWSLLKRKQKQHTYSMTNQHYHHQLTSPPKLDVAYQSETTTTSISTVPYDNNQFDEHEQSNHHNPNYKKTGTTIVGIAGKDYCILGADTRATSNTIVADKYCYKLHPLSQNCAAAGAGTSADLDHITRECYYQTQLWLSSSLKSSSSSSTNYHSPWIGNDPIMINTTTSMSMIPFVPVRQICRYIQQRLYEQNNHCQANLIIGGIDNINNHNNHNEYCGILRAIHPSGNIDIVPYTALGSGSYAAMSILENGIQQYQASNNHNKNDTDRINNNNYNENNDHHHHEYCNLPLQDAIDLVVKAVKAGIDNDLGSGSQVDICIITSSSKNNNGNVVMSNYTRCYLPEETYTTNTNVNKTTTTTTTTISSSSTTKQKDNNHYSTTTSNTNTATNQLQSNGVNGFGNVPYIIRSKRTFLLHNNNHHHININNNINHHKNGTIMATTGIPEDHWNDIIP